MPKLLVDQTNSAKIQLNRTVNQVVTAILLLGQLKLSIADLVRREISVNNLTWSNRVLTASTV